VLFVVNGAPPSTGGVFFCLKLFIFINYLVTPILVLVLTLKLILRGGFEKTFPIIRIMILPSIVIRLCMICLTLKTLLVATSWL
jgi:hypothetical protein